MKKDFKSYFITGLLVVVPLYITVYVLSLIINFMDSVFVLLPVALRPDTYLPFHIPGLGIIVTLFCVFLVGVLTTNFLGKKILEIAERLMSKVPVVRMVYSSTKQFMEMFFPDGTEGFRKVVLVEFPRVGIWSLGFVTGRTGGDVRRKAGEGTLSVFLPTTPNPTSGYYFIVPEKDCVPINISIEDAFKIIITAGMVMPNNDEFKDALVEKYGEKQAVRK